MNGTAEHFAETPAETKPKKKRHIYSIVLLGIFTLLMFLSTLVWDFTWEQLELYEAGHIRHAEEKLSEKFRLNQIDVILDEKCIEYDLFNRREDYMTYMLDVFGNDYTSAKIIKGRTLEDGSVLYDVRLGNTKFAEYALFKNGNNWDYTSADLNDELFVKTHSVKVVVPESAEVRANGSILPDEFVSDEEYTIHDFDDLDDKSLIPRFTVYDTGAVFISEPEVKVYGENGNELVISEEKKTLRALPEPTTEQLAEIKSAAEEAAIAYAMYITQDTSFEPLKKYLVEDSELYRRIKGFYHDWYRDHTTTYDNVVFSDIVTYDEEHFTLHIEFDYHVNIGYRVNDYEVEYTMSMIKIDGVWKIAGMIM
ncbi:MAG: hypothetical protein K2N26_00630 [Oscillospiraceae bacterium]|nr:hypothetical protein [Oscillospiraceae bacterium]